MWPVHPPFVVAAKYQHGFTFKLKNARQSNRTGAETIMVGLTGNFAMGSHSKDHLMSIGTATDESRAPISRHLNVVEGTKIDGYAMSNSV